MSIEAMKQALEALQHSVPKDTKQAREQFDAIQALRTAIQQAEAQQPATPEPSKDEAKRLIDTLRTDASGGRAATVHELDAAADLIEASLFATGEPVLFVSPEQARAVTGKNRVHYTPSDNSGRYLPVRATPAGLFVQPLYTHPAPGVPGDVVRVKLTPLTDAQMEKGREQIFSVNNPYCPCDRKTFKKVAQWVEAHHAAMLAASPAQK